MSVVRGIIDRFEGKTAVLLVEDLKGFKEGQAVTVSITRDAKETSKNQKKVKNLLKKILKGK